VLTACLHLGAARSYHKLREAVAIRWPTNPISIGSISAWGKKDGWRKRIDEFERGQQTFQAAAAATASTSPGKEAEVDDVESLNRAASFALARALRAAGGAIAVQRPSDIKALIELAEKATNLANQLRDERSQGASEEEIAELGNKMLDRSLAARRKDFAFMAREAALAACNASGCTDHVLVIQAAAAQLVEHGDRPQPGGALLQRHNLAVPHPGQRIAPAAFARRLLLRRQPRVLLDAVGGRGAEPGLGRGDHRRSSHPVCRAARGLVNTGRGGRGSSAKDHSTSTLGLHRRDHGGGRARRSTWRKNIAVGS